MVGEGWDEGGGGGREKMNLAVSNQQHVVFTLSHPHAHSHTHNQHIPHTHTRMHTQSHTHIHTHTCSHQFVGSLLELRIRFVQQRLYENTFYKRTHSIGRHL